MVCHECGHRITRERACKTTRKAKSGEMWWKGCEHPIYFARNAIDGLRDKDILEALIHLDTTTITIEAEEFERLDVHVDLLDEPDANLMDITYFDSVMRLNSRKKKTDTSRSIEVYLRLDTTK